ncbi:hypothetical protein ACSBL2_08580 [Pedobacter sp. AW31-3R]|uniref:hypothetical protein n=1 Tax=Pedobacter sp. AW31-3R TaxID=3445781 RepID=UPI003FA07152
MKMIFIKMSLVLFCLIAVLGCKKEQPLIDPNVGAPVKLVIKGLILVDTLQFILEGKIIGQGIEGDIRISDRLYQPGQKIQIRKKGNDKLIDEIIVAESPFNQVKKIFYDGTTFTDKIELTPVGNPENMGVKFRFISTSAAFYGGPVDIELFDSYIDFDLFEFVYTPIKTIPNVSSGFSDFIELMPLQPDHSYEFKVYKAGTKEQPYNNSDIVTTDPSTNYGQLSFDAGKSKLIAISPSKTGNGTISNGYSVQDLAYAFQ